MNAQWIDGLGGVASSVCALHCATMALLPAAGLVLGAELSEGMEWTFFGLALSFALVAAVLGYRTHGSLGVLAGFGAGLFALCLGRSSEVLGLFEGGGTLAILGGLVLLGTHWVNVRRRRACVECAGVAEVA